VDILQHDDGTRLIHKVRAEQTAHWVVVEWESIGTEPVQVVVLRSEERHAEQLAELFAKDTVQTLVYYDSGTSLQDQDVAPDLDLYYTLFARASDGTWHKQDHHHVKTEGDWVIERFEAIPSIAMQVVLNNLEGEVMG